MAGKIDLRNWVYEAVRDAGGQATVVGVAKHIWDNHEEELRSSGQLFYTWQYDMRWAAQDLRRTEKFAQTSVSERGVWEIRS